MKLTRNKIILIAAVVVLLIASLWLGSVYQQDTPVSKGPAVTASPLPQDTPAATDQPEESEPPEKTAVPEETPTPTQQPVQDEYQTAPVPEGKPEPVEPQQAVVTDTTLKCTLSVTCHTILNNMDKFNQDKMEVLPADGIILPPTTVEFYQGESVFHVLQREMKKHKIHLEFTSTPIFNSAYIEGINNLYEFDCGELSGWTYKVNGWFPNYGCSRYELKNGDVVEWLYTCDLGRDVGDNSQQMQKVRNEEE